jgi:hypothetical protein
VWTEGQNGDEAWRSFLEREFHGLRKDFYKPYFLEEIDDPYLQEAALKSLSQAGKNQKDLYDFSFGEQNIAQRGAQKGDLGVCVCLYEEIDSLTDPDSPSHRFIKLFKENNASIALILIDDRDTDEIETIINPLNLDPEKDVVIHFDKPKAADPLGINTQTLLKILLNGHSTAVMALLGRVVGNTMTHVYPSNLKLIGRATHLIQSHVNDTISTEEWRQTYGQTERISYAESNAVLFDAMKFVAQKDEQISEVELSIIRILEACRSKRHIGWEECVRVQKDIGLETYLEQNNPNLRQKQERSRTNDSFRSKK